MTTFGASTAPGRYHERHGRGDLRQRVGDARAVASSARACWVLTQTNTYSGGTTVTAGTLQLGNAAALGGGGLTANGGVLDLNANPISIPSLRGVAGSITDNSLSLSGTTVITVNQTASTTFGGTLVDGASAKLALNMIGSGTLTLTGSSGYTGGTTIAAGIVQVNADAALGGPSGGITFSAAPGGSSTLQFAGNAALSANRSVTLLTNSADGSHRHAGLRRDRRRANHRLRQLGQAGGRHICI